MQKLSNPLLNRISLLIIAAAFFSGCNTLADARTAKGTGPFKVYNAPAETIWNAMPEIIKEAGLDYVAENRAEGYVLAQRGITVFSYGENVAIFIKALENDKTRVEIVSKKSMATNVLAPNWSKKIFKSLDTVFTPAAP